MAGVKRLLGLFPNTDRYENKRNTIYDQYLRLNEIGSSDEFKRFNELDAYLQTDEFIQKKKEILKARYKGSPEHAKEKRFVQLTKRRDIRLFLKVKDSDDLSRYKKAASGKDLKKFEELKSFLKTDEFLSVKKYYAQSAKKKFLQSDLNKTLQQYIQLEKSQRIKSYNKLISHKLFSNYEQIHNSKKLKSFENLKQKVTSSEFLENKSSMKKKEWKQTEDFEKQQQYKVDKKDWELKSYYKLLKSPHYSIYLELKDSDELEAYVDLKTFIESNDYKSQKSEIENSQFENTPEFAKKQEFERLEKDSEIVHFFKYGKSKDYKNYVAVKDSDNLKEYIELKKYTESKTFLEQKEYLTKKAKTRYAESREYELETEFTGLKNDEDIKWYHKNISAKKYEWYRNWIPVFNEDFENTKIDTKKWVTRYYWGDKLLKDSYSTDDEYQYITNGNNLEVSEQSLKIITRKEFTNGRAWHPMHGFIPREYDFTSGLINSGNCFKQKYGSIEAKIKFTGHKDILEAFWLVGDKKIPHIDIVKSNSKTYFGSQWSENEDGTVNKLYKKLSRRKFANSYFIFSIEWTEDSLVWKVNGEEVFQQSENIPQKEMYFLISSHLFKPVKETLLPSQMEVNWIKCYQHVKYQ